MYVDIGTFIMYLFSQEKDGIFSPSISICFVSEDDDFLTHFHFWLEKHWEAYFFLHMMKVRVGWKMIYYCWYSLCSLATPGWWIYGILHSYTQLNSRAWYNVKTYSCYFNFTPCSCYSISLKIPWWKQNMLR